MPASAGAGCASTPPTRAVQPAFVCAQSRCRAALERQPEDPERRARACWAAAREFTIGLLQFTERRGACASAPGVPSTWTIALSLEPFPCVRV